MQVPFVDLKKHYLPVQDKINEAVLGVVERGDFILGQSVAQFEHSFAEFCGAKHAVGLDSGLSALKLALRAMGVEPGDEVILPADTFIATAAAVSFIGGKPVLVDVDEKTYNMDPALIEAAITERTKVIIPVHLYGYPADMDPIMEIANKHDLKVLEDASQAHGAYYRHRRVGSIGHVAAFSLYPAKNLGAYGDAGILVTNDEDIANQVRAMRNCGQHQKYIHELAPYNHRMDTMQAAVLNIKLPLVDDGSASRREAAALYTQGFEGTEVITPVDESHCRHVYHLYVVRVNSRPELQKFLKEKGIGTGIHYPVPVHLQPFYADAGFSKGQFPVTEKLADEILSLPMFPGMTEEQVSYVVEQVKAFYGVPVSA